MTAWSTKDFEDRAERLAATWQAGAAQGGATLNDLVEKAARDHSLNPEQVQRLVAATNTKAFEVKFASMTGQADRHVDFDVANADTVLGRLGEASAPAQEKVASYPDLPDELRGLRLPPIVPNAKLAADRSLANIERLVGREEPLDRQSLRLQKVAQELNIQARQAAHDKWAAMDTLRAGCRRIGWDHDEFEKNAVAVHGFELLPEMNELRVHLRQPLIADPSDRVKAATMARLLGSETPEVLLLKHAHDAGRRHAELSAAHAECVRRLRGLEQQIHG